MRFASVVVVTCVKLILKIGNDRMNISYRNRKTCEIPERLVARRNIENINDLIFNLNVRISPRNLKVRKYLPMSRRPPSLVMIIFIFLIEMCC